jgi:NAD(P)H-hydrate epimerase
MKILTAAQMREVDRRTIEMGIPGIILMENAALRVVEFLLERFAPLRDHRVVVFCGKGNNGGDGLAIARQLHVRQLAGSLDVVLGADPEELAGDAAANYRMLVVAGREVHQELPPDRSDATIVVDAVLGSGLSGPAAGRALELIEQIDDLKLDGAKIVAVDIPSGLPSDGPAPVGEHVRADFTVTFTAPKIAHALPPNSDACGELVVRQIGSPWELYEGDNSIRLSLVENWQFARLVGSRSLDAHKGDLGHVLVVGGSRGKTGAAAMAGLAALRAGAGLVTVASAESAIAVIAGHAMELMTEALAETETGGISLRAFDYGRFAKVLERKTMLALGPGMGTHPDTVAFARRVYAEAEPPLLVDADGLNALAGMENWTAAGPRILTPHPGEMSRLSGLSVDQIQADRVAAARDFASAKKVTLVLKGQRTVVAFPDGQVIVNTSGTPALATGGTGDILTGLIAGLYAQFPSCAGHAVAAAVWLHGRAGELGAEEWGEECLIATDLLKHLPEAMEECAEALDEL